MSHPKLDVFGESPRLEGISGQPSEAARRRKSSHFVCLIWGKREVWVVVYFEVLGNKLSFRQEEESDSPGAGREY